MLLLLQLLQVRQALLQNDQEQNLPHTVIAAPSHSNVPVQEPAETAVAAASDEQPQPQTADTMSVASDEQPQPQTPPVLAYAPYEVPSDEMEGTSPVDDEAEGPHEIITRILKVPNDDGSGKKSKQSSSLKRDMACASSKTRKRFSI